MLLSSSFSHSLINCLRHSRRLTVNHNLFYSRTFTPAVSSHRLFSINSAKMTGSANGNDRKLCMIPGPVEFHEDVLMAMSAPATSHIDPAFINMFGESIEMLRTVLMTKTAQPFIVSGSGTLGWDQVACNLIQPGESVLVINTGLFGDRFGECLATYGANVTHLRADIGSAPTFEAIENELKSGKYRAVTITHVDTSTGVLMDIKKIAEISRKVSKDTLVVVDGVCSVGGEEIRMDEWDIDVVLTASQKALGTPPGLCVLLASDRAMNVFKSRTVPPNSYYASWVKWLPIMNAYEKRSPSYFATPAVQLIMALHKSLVQITSVPLSDRFIQHKKASDFVKSKVASWGLKLVCYIYWLHRH